MPPYASQRLAEAYELAATRSPDPSNQNGAVIYRNYQKCSEGFNHFYPGIPPEWNDRKKKYERIVHAEQDACLRLSRSVAIMDDAVTLFCPFSACKSCAVAIIGAGVRQVVMHRQRWLAYSETWGNQDQARFWLNEIFEAEEWLISAGVVLHAYDGRIPEYNGQGVRVNGLLWNPATLGFV